MANEKRLDLISRQALIAEYDRVHIGAPGGARKLMEDAHTVDAVKVVHGRWEQCFEDWRKQIEGDKCSVCGFEHYGCGIKHYHYCPNCGAKMDGGNEDG